ncbi:nitrous oxide reductase family maturation protein NosD [Cyclobacterium plantarum]|uniref:Nitrous oxide reductase family maturation protein NosD n=1 Tax=Cyclobacterium plantarum TaxID=2716263 RepID=A0ABX0H9M4_9BACT|nr:nitrous oxide reductase family maturation protein NosD [Cyclobacterium plantarum]NHE57146.1 nitrous oxide reductase family maturation protein NosD [Cyclobacterium plantarum]
MRIRLYFLFLVPLVSVLHFGLEAGSLHVRKGTQLDTIKEAIALAGKGDTIFVHEGTYLENQMEINKPMAIIGVNKPVIDSQGGDEIFIVKADQVLIQGLTLQNIGVSHLKDRAAIRVVEARNVIIDNNLLLNTFFGIYLQNASRCRVLNNTIRGEAYDEMNAGNAIHIWKGSQMEVINNHLSQHRDGIYFEFVDQSLIRGNTSQDNMRYGLHFMFSNYDTYEKNIFRRNGAGVAVMFSKQIRMIKNTFEENWGGSSYGILLKEISDGLMVQNTFIRNTIGVYAEGANRIKIEKNDFINNGKAMDIKGNCIDNEILSNNFIGNTFEVLTNSRSNLNHFEGNYWAQYKGYDLNKDGIGDFPHRPVNLFALITDKIPAANMLLHSFLVDALDMAERMFPEIIPEHLSDERPRIKPYTYD